MTSQDNKQIIEAAMAALAQGDSRLFYEAMADDCVWRPMAVGTWGEVHQGKAAARENLFTPLRRQYAGAYTNTPTRILAEGDIVVVESKGAVRLHSGQDYDNRYCFVIEMADGKMREVREYFDTALSEAVLEPLQP